MIADCLFLVENKCSKSQQVTEPEKCASVAEPKLSYNPLLAETLAKWSGAAYTRPEKKDASSVQAAVKSVIGSDYQVGLCFNSRLFTFCFKLSFSLCMLCSVIFQT